MKQRVLITGASGFVGYHLIIAALQKGLDVYAAVRSESNIKHLKPFDIQYTTLDFSSVEKLKADIEDKRYQYIIHAAGTTKAKTPEEYNLINAVYTKNLAMAVTLAEHKAGKFVFVSSLAALGPLHGLSGVLEDDTDARPVSYYGSSKLLAETYLKQIKGLPLIIIRPTAVYGPREKDLFILVKSINRGVEPYIGRLDQKLSFIYVKDLADLIIKALGSSLLNKSFNASDGLVYDRYALAGAVKKALKNKTLKFHIPLGIISSLAVFMERIYAASTHTPVLSREKMKELTAVNWASSIHNIKEQLGFAPRYDLESGMGETIKWYKDNNWL